MGHRARCLTGVERTFPESEIIVTKTDTRGWITYANEVFCQVAGYTEAEALGQPHSIIRHPEMPRCVFKLLWDTIQSGQEIFAYVNNRAKNGDHYWVLAHVTPTFDAHRRIVGYHSSRRCPKRSAIDAVALVYDRLLATERAAPDPKTGLDASCAMLNQLLEQKGISYDAFVLSL